MNKKYLVTNNCYWYPKKGTKRTPHYFEVVDMETGEVKHIKSGAIIQLIRGEAENND